MYMEYFIILPMHLYKKKYLDKTYKYVIWEHPHYFEGYNYNKKKIVLHRASMQYYFEYLKKHKFKVKYIPFNKQFTIKEYYLFDPIDDIKLPGKYEIKESINFILNKKIYEEYRNKTDKFFFNAFYMWGKKKINVMPNVKSKDKYNRKKLNKNIKIPKLPPNKSDQQYISEGIKYAEKHFKNNYGNTEGFLFPVTHKTANMWLTNFINKKLNRFGDFQDSITKDEKFMFHSVLSTSINIGLLNPIEIIKKIMKKKGIPINSREGYIRQLFWREYQRYCYIYFDFNKQNYFGNRKNLTTKWYDGTLGIEPVDTSIKNAFGTGYLHHIERLMIIGNFMNLSGIHPDEGYKWFMEFSCDSYDWVMHQNVLDMVFFVSGGKTMRRPYISSSNYILKMSDYKKGEWSNKWDELYRKFVKKHKKKLHKFRYYFRSIYTF